MGALLDWLLIAGVAGVWLVLLRVSCTHASRLACAMEHPSLRLRGVLECPRCFSLLHDVRPPHHHQR